MRMHDADTHAAHTDKADETGEADLSELDQDGAGVSAHTCIRARIHTGDGSSSVTMGYLGHRRA